MAIDVGSRIGPFEVISPLGAGGMGEVYEARDTRLGRTVALKVLPERLAADPARRARFAREARAVSRLSHPFICTLHDFGEEEIDAHTVHYLVMERVEGETVTARLGRGGFSIEQILTVGRQIAEALAAAHRQGIVHRDLKPENVMLTREGPKLLDFGLALLAEPEPSRGNLKKLPTVSCEPVAAITEVGAIVGTPPYMAPELLEGRDADARSDIFSFGALLYEMTTGRRAFAGETLPGIIAQVMERQPESVSRIRTQVPTLLDHVIGRCLAKDPDERWQSAADIALLLDCAATDDGPTAPPRTSVRLAWSVAGIVTVALLLSLGSLPWRDNAAVDRRAIRFPVPPPPGTSWSSGVEFHNLALSPDGTRLAFVAKPRGEGEPRLWLRPLDRTAAEPLPGTEGASSPFWSPDGRWLAFFTNSSLLKLRPGMGPPVPICDTPGEKSGSWSPHGTIVFAQFFSDRDGIFRVEASGGEPRLLIPYDPNVEVEQRWPVFLPDGKRFLYHAPRRAESGDLPFFLSLGHVDSGHLRTVERLESRFQIASEHLIYVQDGRLLARPFDVDDLEFLDHAILLGDDLPQFVTGWAPFTACDDVVAYRKARSNTAHLVWRDRAGRELAQAWEPGSYDSFALTRNGSRLAVSVREDGENSDLYILDLERMNRTRLTGDDGHETCPIWSPEEDRIAYLGHGSFKGGVPHGVLVRAIGSDVSESLNRGGLSLPWLTDWHGDHIACSVWSSQTSTDLWLLSADGKQDPVLRRGTRFSEEEGTISPNGEWLAYTSNESGRSEIYVTLVEGEGRGTCVSRGGGRLPRWGSDEELFYVSPNDEVHSVSIEAGGGAVTPGPPAPLFAVKNLGNFQVAESDDGPRFLVAEAVSDVEPPIEVIVNWTKEASRPQ